MRRVLLSSLYLLLVLSSVQSANADVVKVSPGGGATCTLNNAWGECGHIQSAIDAAQAGHQVWIAAGTYKPTDTTDRTIAFELKGSVQVYGGFAGTETELDQRNHTVNPTILSGDIGTPDDLSDNTYAVVRAENVLEPACLDGLIVEKGRTDDSNNAFRNDAGGLYVKDSHLYVRNCVFRLHTALHNGNAGLHVAESTVHFYKCEITDNGGPKADKIIFMYQSSSSMTECGIYRNVTFASTSDNFMFYESFFVARLCIIDGNSSPNGCVLYFYNTSGGLDQVVIRNSVTDLGALTIDNNNSNSFIVENCSFYDHMGNDAVLRSIGSELVQVKNSTFSGNRGVRCSAAKASGGALELRGVTITGNTCTDDPCGAVCFRDGGGVSAPVSPSLSVHSSIIWGNTGAADAPVGIYGTSTSLPQVYNSVVETGYAGTNVVTDDPLLIGPKRRLVDGVHQTFYGLGTGSSARDSLIGGTLTRDQLGNARPAGALPDMGAIEMSAGNSYYVNVLTDGFGSGHVVDNAGQNNALFGGDAKDYLAGQDVVLVAVPDAGSAFDGWTGCTSVSGSQCTLESLSAEQTVTVSFRPQYDLSVSHDGTGQGAVTSEPSGISCPGDCIEGYDFNTPVRLTAEAGAGSEFSGWGGSCSGTNATCTVTMTEAARVAAYFTALTPGLSCDAGPDKTVRQGSMVVLAGASNAPSPVTSWAWTQDSGPVLTLEGAETDTVSFTTAQAGTCVLRLTTVTADGNTYSDTANVVVLESSSANQPPIAEAGAVQNVAPGTQVQLDGSLSRDGQSGSLTYGWEQVSGRMDVTLAGADTATPTFTPAAEGGYTFRLTVADPQGARSGDTAIVNVFANHTPPVARAVATCSDEWCTLDARTSSDSFGRTYMEYVAARSVNTRASHAGASGHDVLKDIPMKRPEVLLFGAANAAPNEASGFTFRWVQVQGDAVTLYNSRSEIALFPAASKSGVQTFELTVTDSLGAMATTTVKLAPPPPDPPEPAQPVLGIVDPIMLLLE